MDSIDRKEHFVAYLFTLNGRIICQLRKQCPQVGVTQRNQVKNLMASLTGEPSCSTSFALRGSAVIKLHSTVSRPMVLSTPNITDSFRREHVCMFGQSVLLEIQTSAKNNCTLRQKVN
jgi:hypothetical protein